MKLITAIKFMNISVISKVSLGSVNSSPEVPLQAATDLSFVTTSYLHGFFLNCLHLYCCMY